MNVIESFSATLSRVLLSAVIVFVASANALPATAQETATAPTTEAKSTAAQKFDADLYRQTVKSGVDYLLEKGQADDGSFSKQLNPAVTAMCTCALLANDIPVSHPKVQKALAYMETMIQPNGGIYAKGSAVENYETSIAVMCFQRANADGKYDETIKKAVAFLKGLQWDEGEGYARETEFYGGQGYGAHKRPDASNTSFFMDALEATNEDADSEAIQKALVFMSRCQNLPTEHNTAEWASKASADDTGGYVYSPANGGETKVDDGKRTDVGGLRSYASMTYAGLKSLLYAGVAADDVRVKAAFDWISRHYDLQSNPGMGQQGLFYYYHVFAKTLAATGKSEIVDNEGVAHNWRADLVAQLAEVQKDDGSWINPADRWYEGDPNLVTSYALLALSYCKSE